MSEASTFTAASGEAYERLMGRWSRQLSTPFLDFAGLSDGERVLELGCGTGILTQAILAASEPSNVVAIDYSPAYLAIARQMVRDPRVTLETGNACRLEMPDGSFDRVLSLLMLHHIPRAEQAVAEMLRVLKPGGVAAAAVWDSRGGFVANRMFWDTSAMVSPKVGPLRNANYTRPMTRPGELAAAFHHAGFEAVEEATLAIRMEFACFDDYWRPYLAGDGPVAGCIAQLTGDERSRLEAALRAAYLDGEDDGPRSYAALAFAVRGMRAAR